jgi:protein involved in polysaccharide export with SLBB domain
VPLRNAASAVQALALAGGLKRSASSRNIVLIRLADDGKLQTIPIDISGRGQKAVYEALARTRLISDDIIFVPESGRSEIARFIDDFVTRPLQGANAVLGTYVDFKLVQLLNKQLQ